MRKINPVKHEEKRREILEAAGRCFARDGFRGATISDICAEAKISAGHLYHYFTSKEEIIGAMTEAGLEYATLSFSRMMEEPNAIEALVSEVERMKTKHLRAGQILLLDMLAEAGRNPAIAQILSKHTHGLRKLIVDFLRKSQACGQVDPGLDPELTAVVLISIIDGSKTMAIRDPKLDLKKSIELLKIAISRFLMPPPTARS